MATTIVTKNSSTASAVPTTGQLVQGELAVNVADKKLFTEDNAGSIIVLADGVKLAGIEALADVTDTANVTAAGALMDSEVTNLAQVKAFDSADYATAAQGTTADAALPTTGGAMTGAITTNSTFDGRDVSVDGAKLDGIEVNATADQTALEIKTAYESNADTNAFTDADETKLDGIEASATADQTAAEIKTAYESNADTNAFTDADHTKLDGIEASATADQTDAEIRAAVEAATDSNVFTDADHSKLNAIEASADVTDTANVTAAGALMDSELTNITAVKALNQGVATTDSPQFVSITSTSNVIVGGDLTVNGTTTTLNTATLDVEDKNITINYGAGDTTGSANGAGITIQDAVDASTDATILWDTTNDEFDFSHPINVAGTSVFASLDITGEITANGGIALGDNDKATFGAGDDLQIYHDGSNSYIDDAGTGNLRIRGTQVILEKYTGETILQGIADGSVYIYHDNAEKLATTATGIDVTGTATMDGLTVETSTDPALITLRHTGNTSGLIIKNFSGGEAQLVNVDNGPMVFKTNDAERMRIEAGGQVVLTASTPSIKMIDSDDNSAQFIQGYGGGLGYYADDNNAISNSFHRFFIDGSERMRIDSSGNVGIGTSFPSNYNSAFNDLVVAGSGDSGITVVSGTSSEGSIAFADGTSGADAYRGWINYNHNSNFMRFSTNATERFRIAADGSLSTPTLGTSNVRFGVNAGNSIIAGGNYNVLVGDEAGTAITTGDGNVAVGYTSLQATTTGTLNAGLGHQALYTNTTGTNNTGVGTYALYANTTASNNTAVGMNSLVANTTGTENVALGSLSSDAGTIASYNVAVGHSALTTNVASDKNTAIGHSALANLSSATQADGFNVAVGYVAGAAITTGAKNVLVGVGAGDAITTADNNTAVGHLSLTANTTGTENTAVGTESAYYNTTGDGNTALGYRAYGRGSSTSNSTGSSNTAIGKLALYSTQTASNNTAVGNSALQENTTGTENVAVGAYALDANTTANGNSALGYGSLGANTTGAANVAVGTAALQSNTTASYNVGLGYLALGSNTTGANIAAVGYQAGYSNTTGAENTLFGYQAGYSNSLASYNVFLGHQAGYSFAGSAGNSFNTFVGVQSGYNITTGTKNTIIGGYSGNQGGLDIRTSSNNIVLSDGDGNPRLHINSSGNALIATTNLGGTVNCSRNGNTYNYHAITDANNTTEGFFRGYSSAAGGNRIIIYSNGNIVNSNNSYGAISDLKLKENITDVTPKLNKLNQVRVVNYNLKGENLKQIGVIAQEIEDVFPSMVTQSPDQDENGIELGTTTKSVKYSVFVPILIKAIQEQQALIESLTARLETLEGK